MVGQLPVDTAADAPGALIFRKRWLPYSETFIANQGMALRRYCPLFVGLERHAQGVHHVDESKLRLLADFASSVPLARARLQLGLMQKHPWFSALRAANPRVLHAHFGNGAADAHYIARALGIPLLVTWHGHDISKPLTGSFGRQVRRSIARADHCIAVSNFIAGRLREAGCADEKISVLPTGVKLPDDSELTPVPNNGRVLFVGRLVHKKGVTHLIDAMARVQRQHPDAHLQIVGDGPLKAELADQAQRLGVNVQFMGRLTPAQVLDCMQQACVIAAPSVRTARDVEGLGMVFVEAQSLGRPVVGFDSGGIADAVSTPDGGLLVEEGNVAALAEGLSKALGDPAWARAAGQAARAAAVANQNLYEQTAKLEAIYDRVCLAAKAEAQAR